ncbi:MAG: hypothetical protein A3D92_05260, partial [Bacteroidetes bacterium RIFCSPHIGHO2_02_FULL_44_7]
MNKFGLLFLLLVACSTANAQNAYRYRRALKGVSEQWHKLVLPDEIYGKLNVRFSDLRVLGLASDGDTIEASYLLEAARQKEYVRDIDLQQFNKVQNNGRYYYSFKANSEELINFMHLEFGRSNFSWDIQLEGSMDQKSWFTILKNYHILSLHEAHANYSFTDLHFPATSFRYYRISVPSDVDPLFRKALVRHHELDPGVIHAYAPEHFTVSQKGKQTIVDIELKNAVPIDWLHVLVNAEFDYYRPCSIYFAAGDTLARDERYRNYQSVGSGILSSVELSGIDINPQVAKHWRLIIENFDDEALPIQSAQFYGPVYHLLVRFIGKAKYYLFYGNERASAPRYDLAHFTDLIPEDP